MSGDAIDDPAEVAATSALLWRRHHRGLQQAAALDRPWAWALLQAAEHARNPAWVHLSRPALPA